MTLHDLGWSAVFGESFDRLPMRDVVAARVARQDVQSYNLLAADGPLTAGLAGRLRRDGPARGATPVVGDWVAVTPLPDGGVIRALLPRRSAFSRQVAGGVTGEQVVAANIDTVFIVTGLDGEFNLRRLERYLTVASVSGATPVVLLNKADGCPDPAARLAEVGAIASGVAAHTMSALDGAGLDAVQRYLGRGRTVAFIGSSGVGKSTIVNRLAGPDRMAVAAVRRGDDHGRHTTTHRELVVLPGGGMVIDTPGMRELRIWEGGEEALRGAFADIEDLALTCRFADCAHETEPGCAIRLALETGALDAARYGSYLKIRQELDRATVRQGEAARREERLRGKNTTRLHEEIAKHGRRRKGR